MTSAIATIIGSKRKIIMLSRLFMINDIITPPIIISGALITLRSTMSTIS